ncbi:hypothetical protein OEZ86_012454 [Tetradesmus obliquus]|nr:hypothetical protein OEZ86_012454 [Tetradesmus obliquus]
MLALLCGGTEWLGSLCRRCNKKLEASRYGLQAVALEMLAMHRSASASQAAASANAAALPDQAAAATQPQRQPISSHHMHTTSTLPFPVITM